MIKYCASLGSTDLLFSISVKADFTTTQYFNSAIACLMVRVRSLFLRASALALVKS
ncbi:MAG: hypothetical protein RMY34_13740 [Aulosira sp. DedQUE10]|nr:hypothetical protein [Aulosira sp. DedQUE10]